MRDFENEFNQRVAAIAKTRRTIAIVSMVWTVFALSVFGTFVAVAVHFVRKIW